MVAWGIFFYFQRCKLCQVLCLEGLRIFLDCLYDWILKKCISTKWTSLLILFWLFWGLQCQNSYSLLNFPADRINDWDILFFLKVIFLFYLRVWQLAYMKKIKEERNNTENLPKWHKYDKLQNLIYWYLVWQD